MWLKDLLLGMYEILKKQNASKAQKKSLKEAREQAEARLLTSGVLLEFMDKLERLEIIYLDHLDQLHKKQAKTQEEIEDESPPPPPPQHQQQIPAVEVSDPPRPLTTRDRQFQIIRALEALER